MAKKQKEAEEKTTAEADGSVEISQRKWLMEGVIGSVPGVFIFPMKNEELGAPKSFPTTY